MKTSIQSIAAAAILCLIPGGSTRLSAQTSAQPKQPPVSVVSDVFTGYLAIQKALSEDSLENVPGRALAIASLVSQDRSGRFRPELAAQAEALAAAADLPTARQIFKAVSGYLIQTWSAGHGPGGVVHEVHSPTDNVDWLQQGEVVQNPYQGKPCQQCGTFVK